METISAKKKKEVKGMVCTIGNPYNSSLNMWKNCLGKCNHMVGHSKISVQSLPHMNVRDEIDRNQLTKKANNRTITS